MEIQKKITAIALVFGLLLPITIFAQDEDLFPGGKYDNNIPTPLEIIGHQFGENYIFQWEMEDYIQTMKSVSERVKLVNYGKTYQGRKLWAVIISSPENISRLEEIRTANLKLTDPRKISEQEAGQIADTNPAIVWLGYNIHGNEASGMEAAIRTIYQLIAGTDEITQNILNNVVCIIDPVQNPDGHDRFVQYVRSVVTVKSHPQLQDVEHDNPWPGGRTNHYLFDLNRDFFLKTQVESQQKAQLYHKWMPQVFADLHEMGSNSTYFFAPPMTPYNEYVKPELTKWWNIIAAANATAFDRFGWGYYTKESFDAFYPGYGVSYPSINGATGMTYEEASSRGVSIKRKDGTILSLREAAWHHFTTSMATLQVIAERRKERIQDFYQFFVHSLKEAEQDPIKEIVFTPKNDPQIAAKLVNNLLMENVEILRATESFSNAKATSYFDRKTEKRTFPEGSYIIRLAQPQKVLIKTLLAPQQPLSEEFIAAEKKRKENHERSHFYDVTAWSMPLTYGVDAYWTREESDVNTEKLSSAPQFSGSVKNGPAQQAYLIPYHGIAASKMLVALLAEDYKVRIARKSFTLAGKKWQTGTLVVRVNRNDPPLHDRISELARHFGVEVTAVHHGLAGNGIDLGSNNIAVIQKPKVALLTEKPVASYSYGEIHYLFEREFGLPFTRITSQDVSDLQDYNVLVLPNGRYPNKFINKEQLGNFKNWIRSGGVVVAISGAVNWLCQDSLISKAKRLNDMPDPQDEEKKIQVERTPGAIVKVNLASRSFLSYGCPSSVAALVYSGIIFLPFEDDARKNVGMYAPIKDLRLSGFIWQETEKQLAEKAYLLMEPVGKGKLILFTEDPNFRASYDGLNKLFLNAIVLGPGLD